MMKIVDWLKSQENRLKSADISTSRLDCLVLLEDTLLKDRAYLLAHPELQLNASHITSLEEKIVRRMDHVPLAYIRGKTEFFGREFIINQNVLEPRPESETLIELLLQERQVSKVLDIGCGSGALGITAALECSTAHVTLVDIDKKCLQLAKENAQKYSVAVDIEQGDLISNLDDTTVSNTYIIANLPYVPDNFRLNQAAMNEPQIAIFGGKDGLDIYRNLFSQITTRNLKPAAIYCESLPTQHATLRRIAESHNFVQISEADFIQVFSLLAPPLI